MSSSPSSSKGRTRPTTGASSSSAAAGGQQPRRSSRALGSSPAAQMAGGTNIAYPPGCEEVQQRMNVDQLIRRLKALASAFQGMGQQEENNVYDQYVPLCHHLEEEGFLSHSNRNVRLFVACCIADILRIFAPDAPYTDPEQVMTIFKFLISQLEGLKDTKDAAFSKYFYLLENLAYVKSFSMCCELEDSASQEIFCDLFDAVFSVVNDDHSGKVKDLMLELLSSVVSESDMISNELLSSILINLIKPSECGAYGLAKALIQRCSDSLEPYVHTFFNKVLIYGKQDPDMKKLPISHKVFDLIHKLNHICPNMLISVIPQLEYKLKSLDEDERLGCVNLLAKMFLEQPTLASEHGPLWQAFLGRFSDISAEIRNECVKSSTNLLITLPTLRDEIVEVLASRQHDTEENIRYEVVKAVVGTSKQDFQFVMGSEVLLKCVKERALDKKFKVRKEALQGLGMMCKTYFGMEDADDASAAMEDTVASFKDTILHGYYLNCLETRILVERLLITSLVPYNLEHRSRMTSLLTMYSTVDDNSKKVFIEIQKNLLLVRRHIGEFLNVIKNPNHEDKNEISRQLNYRISVLSQFLPDPIRAKEFIRKFSKELKDDSSLMATVKVIVDSETGCKTRIANVKAVLKKLGAPVATNGYYGTIKTLLERAVSVLFDMEAILELVSTFSELVEGTYRLRHVEPQTAIAKGSSLISTLSSLFTSRFDDEEILKILISLLDNDRLTNESAISNVLTTLIHIGKYRPIHQQYPDLADMLIQNCQQILEVASSPKLGKLAVRCLHANTEGSERTAVFSQLLPALRQYLDPTSRSYSTSIVILGHIAQLMPEEFREELRNIMSRKIIKEVLVNPNRTSDGKVSSGAWCELNDLPSITKCMLNGMKATVRWLIGLADTRIATKTFKMLSAFVETGGNFINSEVPFSPSEKSWLRLTAGKCMLKICEHKEIGDQFTAAQFYILSSLMNDPVEEVRSHFIQRLQKGLSRGFPSKCLPLNFMGFYALMGYESDKQLRNTAKTSMIQNISKRREYIGQLLKSAPDKAPSHLPHVMPDYMLMYAVPVLAHSPKFSSHQDIPQLEKIKECLWFILEPLILKNDVFSYGFYKTLIERMKNHESALEIEDNEGNQEVNSKMYAICDMALGLINQNVNSFQSLESTVEHPHLPSIYFKRRHNEDRNWVNRKNYLPSQIQFTVPKKAVGGVAVVGKKASAGKGGGVGGGRGRKRAASAPAAKKTGAAKKKKKVADTSEDDDDDEDKENDD